MIGDRKTNIFGRLVRHRQKAAVFFWKTVGPARAQRQRRFVEDGASFVDRRFGTAGQGAVFDLKCMTCVERPTVYSIRRPGVAIRTRT